MLHKTDPSSSVRLAALIGFGLMVIGATWWLWLLASSDSGTVVASRERRTPPASASSTPVDVTGPAAPAATTAQPQPTPQPEPARPTPTVTRENGPGEVVLGEPVLFDDDLGTGSTEFSGVALNESENRLMVVDDEGRLFEFDLAGDGTPVVPARRILTVEFGDTDIEGISWIAATTYVIAHEGSGLLSVVDIAEGQQEIGRQHVRHTVDTGVRETNGSGIEGVSRVETLDGVEYAVVVESPPRLLLIDDDDQIVRSELLDLGLVDVSGVWVDARGQFWFVSDLSRVAVQAEVSSEGGITELLRIDLSLPEGRFEQAEGIVTNADLTRLYLVSETPGTGRFSLGVWPID